MAPRTRAPRLVLMRYLSREFLTRVCLCAGILVALMEILTLLEQTTPILERHLGARGIMTYALLRLPLLLDNALPLSTLVGALLMLTQMSLSSEVAIMRAAGLSTPALYRLLLPATLVISVLTLALDDQITPRTELHLAAWWNATDPQPDDSHDFWFRDHELIVNVGYLTNAGQVLHRTDLYRRDGSGMLVHVAHAAQARFEHGSWMLEQVRDIEVTHAQSIDSTQDATEDAPLPSRRWDTALTPPDAMRLSMDVPLFTTHEIYRIMRGQSPSSLPLSYYHTALLGRLTLPLFFVVMVLLALPVVYIPPRTGTRSWIPVWCLGGGLLFVVFEGLLRALSNAGTLPVTLAIVPGIAIFAFSIATVLLRMEEQ